MHALKSSGYMGLQLFFLFIEMITYIKKTRSTWNEMNGCYLFQQFVRWKEMKVRNVLIPVIFIEFYQKSDL